MTQKTPIEGSEVTHRAGARPTRRLRANQRIRATLILKSSPPKDPATGQKVDQILTCPPQQRPKLTEQELEDFQCADDANVEEVRRIARAHGLTVVDVSRVRHDVVLEGKVSAFEKAFQTKLRHFKHKKGGYRAPLGPVHVPANLRNAVQCVLGLDTITLLWRPFAATPSKKGTPSACLTPSQVAEYYCFPPDASGKGQRIVLIEFAGGYHRADVHAYFKQARIQQPHIKEKSLHGVANNPLDGKLLRKMIGAIAADPEAATRKYAEYLTEFMNTVEVTMDVEVAGGLAPGAEITVLFAPAEAQGWRDAIYAASMEHDATIISISWGDPECNFSEAHVSGINDALEAARLKHVTICCASGDFGSRAIPWNDPPNQLANVAFPASSPYVLACGGTSLQRSEKNIRREVAWKSIVLGTERLASGGGISGRFPLPRYQARARVPRPGHSAHRKTWLSKKSEAAAGYRGRGVPDVAANADSTIGYRLVVAGQGFSGGGTSAVAPLWAALIARLNEKLGSPLGWLNPVLYLPQVARTFRPITHGDNDVCDGRIAYYRARPGWSGCTGLGAPDGARLLVALRGLTV